MRLAWVSQEEATRRLAGTLQNMWASSTLRDRQALWKRYTNFLEDHRLDMTAVTAACFVESCNVEASTRLTYSKTLAALFKTLNIPHQVLSMQARGLRGMGALIPDHQAPPITREEVLRLAGTLTPSEAAFVLLMWKTASRWDEMSKITTANLILRTPDEIIVNWLDLTKTTRQRPFTPTAYTVVKGDWTATICRDLVAGPNQPLTRMRYDEFVGLLQQTFPNRGFTAHSFKRGAIIRAAQIAEEQQISPVALSLLGKHKITVDLSEQTLRYTHNTSGVYHLARMLGTGQITEHL